MRENLPNILITGGAGFIGSMFARKAIQNYNITIVDKLTYAGDSSRLLDLGEHSFYLLDICEDTLEQIIRKQRPDYIVHFAAETHVDRSINSSKVFLETNILGTQNLLEIARKYPVKKFIYISTDEVYGEIKEGSFKEDSPIKPNNPYSVSKAAADLLVQSYIRTYNFPGIIVRACNNYGIWQYPEKLVPVVVNKAINNKKIPIYGKGEQIREWLNTEDFSRALLLLLEKGQIGEIYNIGSGREERNIDVVKEILKILGKSEDLIEFVKDRPGHDFRYSLDHTKIMELGWNYSIPFLYGLKEVVNWNVNYKDWIEEKLRENK